MLDTIKQLLNIADSSKDATINHKISYYQLLITDYCFEDAFPVELEPIVIELIVSNWNTSPNVKSIQRGDVTTQFKDKYADLAPFTNQLSFHRRIRVGGL